jgi:simple sugar transport system permease protein
MGGRVYLSMTLVGVMIMQLLTTSMLVAGMPPEYNMIMKAVLVLLVLLLQARNMRKLFADLLARGRS